jgi:hypothetical protein
MEGAPSGAHSNGVGDFAPALNHREVSGDAWKHAPFERFPDKGGLMDKFTEAYIECALWSSTDNSNDSGGDPLDDNYGVEDIAPKTLEEMKSDCADFQESFGDLIADDLERAGHDFWLTRNGHGAGFWDGDWQQPMPTEHESAGRYRTVGEFLTAMSKPYGSVDLYVGDDGMIY